MNSQIVVGVDGSAAGHAALRWAGRRAADFRVPLNLVRVIPGPWSFRHTSQYVTIWQQAAELLAEEAHWVSALDPAIAVTTTLSTGETGRVLQRLSLDADMIVVGTDRRPDRHGEGFGSISFQTAVISNCVVTVVPATGAADQSGVVVGTDGSANSAIALEWAAMEASRLGQELTVVHACDCWEELAAESGNESGPRTRIGCEVLEGAAAGLAREHPSVRIHLVLERNSSPAAALVRAAAYALLLVIGCRGRSDLDVLVGSVARDVLVDIQCPTLITHPARKEIP